MCFVTIQKQMGQAAVR